MPEKELETGELKVVDITESQPRKDLKFYKAFTATYKDAEGKIWQGSFVLKRLTIGDKSRLAMRVAAMEGGLSNIDRGTHGVNTMMAHMELAFVEKPTWFNAEELYEDELVMALFAEVAKFEETFRTPVGRRREGPEGDSEK